MLKIFGSDSEMLHVEKGDFDYPVVLTLYDPIQSNIEVNLEFDREEVKQIIEALQSCIQ